MLSTAPGARRHAVTGHLLPTPSCLAAVFVLGQKGGLFGNEWQPVWELGWEWVGGVGWAGRGQAHGLSQASRQLRFWDPGLGRPKAFEQMVTSAQSPQPRFPPCQPSESPRDPLHAPRCSPTKPVSSWSCALTEHKARAAGSLRKGDLLVRG